MSFSLSQDSVDYVLHIASSIHRGSILSALSNEYCLNEAFCWCIPSVSSPVDIQMWKWKWGLGVAQELDCFCTTVTLAVPQPTVAVLGQLQITAFDRCWQAALISIIHRLNVIGIDCHFCSVVGRFVLILVIRMTTDSGFPPSNRLSGYISKSI